MYEANEKELQTTITLAAAAAAASCLSHFTSASVDLIGIISYFSHFKNNIKTNIVYSPVVHEYKRQQTHTLISSTKKKLANQIAEVGRYFWFVRIFRLATLLRLLLPISLKWIQHTKQMLKMCVLYQMNRDRSKNNSRRIDDLKKKHSEKVKQYAMKENCKLKSLNCSQNKNKTTNIIYDSGLDGGRAS